ncbi:IS630 family transposase [Archangium primigenium]|nr:IS630 family transposase [Archangium primigenium]
MVLRLRAGQRRKLLRWAEKKGCPLTLRRCMAVAKVGQGLSYRAVARELLCSVSTVADAVRRYKQTGRHGLLDRRAGNGRRKVGEPYEAQLKHVLEGTPQDMGWLRTTWTRELLACELERRGLPRVSVTSVGRALERVGASLKRPQPVVLCPWPAPRRARRVWQLKCLAAHATANEPVFYADEMDVHLNPKPGRDWMLSGHRRLLVTPGNNRKGYVAGALESRTGRLSWVKGANKTSDLFIELLHALVQEHPRATRLHVILDNASMHHSQKTRRALAALGGRVVLHFLPPYCPSANKIERVWWDVHAHVTRNHRRADLDSLLGDVDAYLEGRNLHATSHPTLRNGYAPLAA